MHDTAIALGRQFFQTYLGVGRARILDIGSRDVNGTLRGEAPPGSTYTGVDLEAGPGVDIVLQDPYSLPFEENEFDAVVSSSCFEHDPMFWLTFTEMIRVTRQQGHIYVNAPSNGTYHLYPSDNWRFYPDSGKALVAWAQRHGSAIVLVESFIARRQADVWNDCVMVFCKGQTTDSTVSGRIVDAFPASYNIRRSGDGAVTNLNELTEDMILLRQTDAEAVDRAREAGELGAANELLRVDLARSGEISARLEAEVRANAITEYHLRGELLRLRKSVDRLERQNRDTATGLVAARAEIETQRTRLAEGEAAAARAREETGAARAMLAESMAALGAAQAESETLRDELAISREVGRAMAAAFRTDLSAPPTGDGRAGDGRAGWWRRLFGRVGLAPLPQ